MVEGLQRRLGFGLLTAYGIGVMVGAGIYVLIGAVAGLAGSLAPVAFLLAGLVALPTALSFAELSSRIPEAGGAAAYLGHAFDSPWPGRITGLAIVLAGTISAAAVLRGGVGYLETLLPVPPALAITLLALALTAVAVLGVAESVKLAAVLTVIEIGGLALVISAGFIAPAVPVSLPSPDIMSAVWVVLAATALAFFAFIGFEDMVNLAEETRAPTKTMPRALITALVVVAGLYALVAFAAVRAVPAKLLAASAQPLALVWAAGFGAGASVLAAIAVAAALNGVLAQIVMAARVLYGLGAQTPGMHMFRRVHARFGTPHIGTVLVGLAVALGAISLPVAELAQASSTVLLIVFIVVNIGLIRLKRRAPDAPFRVPDYVPVVGAVLSGVALLASLGV
jgi:APA family basic amino acid/polyamine antiporter